MTAQQWIIGREAAGLTQVEAAEALHVSQPYLSQLETGAREASAALAKRAARLYALPATALPLPMEPDAMPPDRLARQLAGLGYPPFAHVRPEATVNPAGVVFAAVTQADLDTRVVEALPWVVARFIELDWRWLVDQVKLRNAQNRLGYVARLGRELLGRRSPEAQKLARPESELEAARLANEGTLCRDSMAEAEKRWLRKHRPPAAKHWNLLTSLTVEQLPYGRR
jgi:transcriptional regulator with XRE-family HTH domain